HPGRRPLSAPQARGEPLNVPPPATTRAETTAEERVATGKASRPERHPAALIATAMVLFLLGGGLQYGLSVSLGTSTTLSRDAISAIASYAQGLWLLLSGFALSFLGRGYRPLEIALASLRSEEHTSEL